MTLSNWQFSYNGLTFGGALTNVNVVEVQGLEDLPSISSSDANYPRGVGMLQGLDFPTKRSVSMSLEIYPSTGLTLAQTVEVVKGYFLPLQNSLLPLQFQLPGLPAKLVYCRPRKRATPIDVTYSVGYATMAIQLDAVDPRIYAATASSGSCTLPTPSSGMTFNATFNLTFGGTTGLSTNQISCVNAGTYPTEPTLTISGGVCTNPRIELTTSPSLAEEGNTLSFNITLGSTDSLVINLAAHTVILDGSGDRYFTLNPGSQWFDLQPGTSIIGFFSGDASPTGATLTANWSSAWI